MTPSVPRDPQLLRLGTALMTAQGTGLFAAALYLLVRAFTSPVHSAGIAALDVVCALIGALAFAGVARGLRRLSPAARTPAYILEFLCLPIGVGLFQGHQPAWGTLVLGSALVTIGLLIKGLPKINNG